ncbi:MAG TPA: hypothetical protein VIW70_05695 [Rubrivivax sp.]
MASQRRLQLANRMHLQLLRHLGHGVDIERLLRDSRYARDVLLVCDAMPEHGLRELAARFRGAEQEDLVAHPMAWAQDTSGFGVSAPAPAGTPIDIDLDALESAGPERRRGWLAASRWFPAR